MDGQQGLDEARIEAEDLADYDQYLDITGCDIDHRMVDIVKANSFEAGLGDLVEFKQMQVRDISTRKEYGVIVGNPPYGERLGEKKRLSRCIGKWAKPSRSLILGQYT